MKKNILDSISKKAEYDVQYLLFLTKHSDNFNFFQINWFFSAPARLIHAIHKTSSQQMVKLISFLSGNSSNNKFSFWAHKMGK